MGAKTKSDPSRKKRIERERPRQGPPRRQDLTPLVIFWSYVKNIVYGEKVRNLVHLRERIRDDTEGITLFLAVGLIIIWRVIEFRLERRLHRNSLNTIRPLKSTSNCT